MASRTSFESGMENAVGDMKMDYEEYKSEFQRFFPEIVKFSENFLK